MTTSSSSVNTLPTPANITSWIDEALQNYAFTLCMLVLALSLSVLTNISTIHILNRTDTLHHTESLLYKALAISDINGTASLAIYITLYRLQVTQGCLLMYLYTVFVLYTSVVIIVLVNINRFIMIIRPLHHMRLVTQRRLYISLIVGILSTLALIIVIYALGVATILRENACHDFTPQNNVLSDVASNILLGVPVLLGLVIIVFTSGGILRKSRQQARKIAHLRQNVLHQHGQPDWNNPQGNHRAVAANGLKGLRTVGAITISYIVVWLPPLISLGTTRRTSSSTLLLMSIILSLSLCNTIWNPLILFIANKPFRTATMKAILRTKTACCGGNV